VTTKFSRDQMIGYFVGVVCALMIGQTASAITIPPPPKPPEFQTVCYYSFHLIGSYVLAPYAEVVFAASVGNTSCSNLNATLNVSNIVGIAVGTGTTSPAALSNYGPFTLASLRQGESADGLPESASVSVVNGVATLNSLDLFFESPTTYQFIQLQSEGESWVDLDLYQFNIQLTLGSMALKNSWAWLLRWGASIPPLTNPPSGEFPQ